MDMNQNEQRWDKLLQIKTTGLDKTNSNHIRYPYEPTPYCVLERLAASGYIEKKNTVLDYGTGKGRVCFYLSYQIRCRSIGVEYNEHTYAGAMANQQNGVSGEKVSFVMESAERYRVPAEVDRCYFFNPFSIEILWAALARIVDSCYENPRNLQLFFYYPSDEYVAYLMAHEALLFVDEIDCRDLFPGDDPREKILIFEVI